MNIGTRLRRLTAANAPRSILPRSSINRNGARTFLTTSDKDEEAPSLRGIHPELACLLQKSSNWSNEMREKDAGFFDRIGSPQKPKYLYIGSCDARVDPTTLMDVEYGQLFIHRNFGNIVCGSDLNVLSAIEYAVERLGVPHVIVCGHYDCSAVRASHTQTDHGMMENWLRNIRDVQRLHNKELSQIADAEMRHRRLVELHTIEQCNNVLKTGVVQQARRASFNKYGFAVPRVHALVFDPAAGELKKLPVSWKNELKDFGSIYDLYPDS
ncbi:hypothetical protein HDU78_006492 [Chytriomyces hyalinus]|nr:hypothetical protein HDU78_006492 [Chytriomyces hyalinus]KAJ3252796.1 hypothetical protein HDU77_004926 [Chytriomyces hyalinus]